jgi:hypothetical protein
MTAGVPRARAAPPQRVNSPARAAILATSATQMASPQGINRTRRMLAAIAVES